MSAEAQLGIVGLATDPNAHQAGRRGALRLAEHVVIDLPGSARQRPPFNINNTKAGISFSPRSLRVFRGTRFVTSFDGSAWRLETPSAVLTGDATPPDPTLAGTSWAESRQALFHTSASGVRKVESDVSTASSPAGIDWISFCPQSPVISGVGGIVGPGQVAYRFVGVRRDANGYVRRSTPSDRLVCGTGTNGSQRVNGGERIYFRDLVAGDTVEAYRTRTAAGIGAPPAADHYLAWSHDITSAEVTAGYFLSPDDALADDDLGAALYTNPQREGILGGKEPPPLATVLALFSGCLWFGNTVSKHRLELSILDVGGALSTYRTDTGLQCRRFSGNFSAGLNTITGVADVTGLAVGMALTNILEFDGPAVGGSGLPANTKITGITGAGPYTVTMSNVASSGGAGSVDASDVLVIGGVEFFAYKGPRYEAPTATGRAPRCFTVTTSADYSERIWETAFFLAAAINHYALTTPGFNVKARLIGDATGGGGQLILEEVGIGGAGFSVSSPTRPLVFTPRLTNAQSSSNDDRAARLWWSDPEEPEAVPLLNYVDVGSQVDPILALTTLNASLLIWKQDGLYRLSGVAPDSWRVDVIDPSLRLLRSECVDVMDGVAYAWTNRGVVAVTEGGGVRSISAGLIDQELLAFARVAITPGARGIWLACHRARRLVLLGVAEDSDSDATQTVYCWSAVTESWTTWPISVRCATYDRVDERLVIARGDATWELRSDSDTAGDGRGYDGAYTISGWTSTAGSKTLTLTTGQAGAWVPKEGDWISATVGGSPFLTRVLAASLSGSWTLALEVAYPSGVTTSRTAYEGITSRIEWQPLSGGGPQNGALWRELQAHMHGAPSPLVSASVARVVLGGRSDVAASRYTAVVSPPFAATISRVIRAGVSRQVGRAHHFYPYIEVNRLSWAWRLSGLGVVFEVISEKVRK